MNTFLWRYWVLVHTSVSFKCKQTHVQIFISKHDNAEHVLSIVIISSRPEYVRLNFSHFNTPLSRIEIRIEYRNSIIEHRGFTYILLIFQFVRYVK